MSDRLVTRSKRRLCSTRPLTSPAPNFAKSWALLAATRLAHLWHSQGKTTEARDILAPIYGWFTEGFDSAYPEKAKALLFELARPLRL